MRSTRGQLFPAGTALLGVGMWIALAGSASAQMGGGGAGGGGAGGGGGGLGGGGGGMGGGGGLGGAGGGAGGAGGTSLGGSSSSTPGGTSLFGNSGSGGGGSSASTVSSTNFLSSTYSNPAWMGRPNQIAAASNSASTITSTLLQSVGGFGQPSFGTATSSGSTSTNRLGGTTGTASTSSSAATRYSGSPANSSRLAYSAVLVDDLGRPAGPVSVSPQQIRSVLDRSSRLSNPSAIQVVVNGPTVLLRGNVTSESERRLAENMIRLTPGVRRVQNDLVALPAPGTP